MIDYERARLRRRARSILVVAGASVGIAATMVGCERGDDGNALQKINGSVHVAAGNAVAAAETVNGGIEIDANAAVTAANTVNGGIHLREHATADSLNTVNGGISVGAGAHVAKNAASVNGGIDLRDGAEVLGTISNVNGKIVVHNAHVAGGIKTVAGDITISSDSRVEGGILIEKSNSLIQFGKSEPRVEIGPGAVVKGDLRFERPVKLYVSDKASIGPVTGANPTMFTGDTAPQD